MESFGKYTIVQRFLPNTDFTLFLKTEVPMFITKIQVLQFSGPKRIFLAKTFFRRPQTPIFFKYDKKDLMVSVVPKLHSAEMRTMKIISVCFEKILVLCFHFRFSSIMLFWSCLVLAWIFMDLDWFNKYYCRKILIRTYGINKTYF